MLRTLLDLLFPKRSLAGKEGEWITDEERRSMKLFPTLLHQAELRRMGLTFIDSIVAAGNYDSSPLLRKAILTLKYKRIVPLGKDIALRMNEAKNGLLTIPLQMKNEERILCPVPLHWTRKNERGFNQAEILSRELSTLTGWKEVSLLSRKRPTGHQTRRNREDRLTALIDAFAYMDDGKQKPPAVVVLIDDLCTTGATLNECARALKKAGVKHVTALVAALG